MSASAPPVSADAESRADAAPPSGVYAWRWIVLAVVLAAEVMDLMDATIVNVASPSIRADLGGGATTLQWLSAAYTLAFAVLLVTGARLGDIFGRRRLFLIGSAGFTAMSAACAAAPSPGVLIITRALQGAFGALLIPQGFGMLKEVFPEEEMPKVFAAFGPVMGLSAIAAPILAGVLIDADVLGTGWRLVFLINLPDRAVRLHHARPGPAPRCLARGSQARRHGHDPRRGSAVAIIYPLIQGRADGWPAWIFVMLGQASRCWRSSWSMSAIAGVTVDRTGPVAQPHLRDRDRRGAGLLRHLRRAAAAGLAVLPARRALLADPRRPDADADDRGDGDRDDPVVRARRHAGAPHAPHRRGAGGGRDDRPGADGGRPALRRPRGRSPPACS